MFLIVGLGNPGKEFDKTRHNVGFMVADGFAKKNAFAEFRFVKKFNALLTEGLIDGHEVMIAKPQTFMNNSGAAVKALMSNFKFKNLHVFVVHDDIAIPLGNIKISKDRGSAGHKGVESIIEGTGTKNFIRFRIGIGLKTQLQTNRIENLVVKKFPKREEKTIKQAIVLAMQAIELSLKEGVEKAMTQFNA